MEKLSQESLEEITKKVSTVLQLPVNDNWGVIDVEDNLALVHYKASANMEVYGHLRGVLIDLEVGAILADSFSGYTPVAVTQTLSVMNNKIFIKDQNLKVHVFEAGKTIIKRIFEGVVIRVIWHKGKLYRITHKKINPERSHWGPTDNFLSMYEKAQGPKAEDLFDVSKPFSNTCYHFFLVDDSLLIGSRQRVNKPYLVLIAQRIMDIKRPEDQVAVGIPKFKTTDTIGSTVDESIIHTPMPLSVIEANNHLRYGYYEEFKNHNFYDPRESTGEAVIVYTLKEGSDRPLDIVKVHSPSYEWRLTMRGNNPNIVHQFYYLLNTVYKEVNNEREWREFLKRYILFPLLSEQQLRELYQRTKGILAIPGSYGRINLSQLSKNRSNRIHMLWINYVYSLPFSKQEQAIEILRNFFKDRKELALWIQELEGSKKSLDELEQIHKRIRNIVEIARASCRNYKTVRIGPQEVIKNSINNFINKENGISLYAMIKQMKLFKSNNNQKEQEN